MDYLVGVAEILPLLLDGLLVTVLICALAALGALAFAVLLLAARRSGYRWLRGLSIGYVAVMRGLPIVVFVFLLYFGLPALLGLGRVSAFWVGVVALAMNGAAFVSEVLRGAIARIDVRQSDAGRALGLRRLQIWRLILVPQFLPIALPALTGELGFLVKASPALSLITVVDLTRRSQQVAMQMFDPLAPLLAAAMLYFLLLWSLSLLSRRLEIYLEPKVQQP